jgi:hypothetical protein
MSAAQVTEKRWLPLSGDALQDDASVLIVENEIRGFADAFGRRESPAVEPFVHESSLSTDFRNFPTGV